MAASREDMQTDDEEIKACQFKTYVKEFYTARSALRDTITYFNWGILDNKLRKQFYQHDDALAATYLEDVYHSYSALLYFQVVQPLLNRVKGKRLLEIGCATGKGLKLVSSLLQTKEQVGIDLNVNLLQASKHELNDSAIQYITGDAETLPLADNSFDIIVSVESSHQYPRPALFFKEVFRVLRPGGYFCYTDFSSPSYHQMDSLHSLYKKERKFKILKKKNITRKVQASIFDRLVNREDEFCNMILTYLKGDEKLFKDNLAYSAKINGMTFLPKYQLSNMSRKLKNFILKDLIMNCYHSQYWDKKRYMAYLIQKTG